MPAPPPPTQRPEDFAYFTLRVARGAGPLAGIIEHLGTQQKSDFADVGELAALLERWAQGRASGEVRS